MSEDDDGTNPSREIYKRGVQKKVNRQAGSKIRGVRDTESMLESNIMIAGHVDPRVRWIYPQPVSFDLNTGKTYTDRQGLVDEFRGTGYQPWIYTPDFRFELHDGSSLYVEGKHEFWLKKSGGFSDVLEAMFEYGHKIVLATNETFPRELERNIRLLKLRMERSDHACAEERVFSFSGQRRAADLMKQYDLRQSDLLDAILHGTLRADLKNVLGPGSLFDTGDGSKSHLEVLPI